MDPTLHSTRILEIFSTYWNESIRSINQHKYDLVVCKVNEFLEITLVPPCTAVLVGLWSVSDEVLPLTSVQEQC